MPIACIRWLKARLPRRSDPAPSNRRCGRCFQARTIPDVQTRIQGIRSRIARAVSRGLRAHPAPTRWRPARQARELDRPRRDHTDEPQAHEVAPAPLRVAHASRTTRAPRTGRAARGRRRGRPGGASPRRSPARRGRGRRRTRARRRSAAAACASPPSSQGLPSSWTACGSGIRNASSEGGGKRAPARTAAEPDRRQHETEPTGPDEPAADRDQLDRDPRPRRAASRPREGLAGSARTGGQERQHGKDQRRTRPRLMGPMGSSPSRSVGAKANEARPAPTATERRGGSGGRSAASTPA